MLDERRRGRRDRLSSAPARATRPSSRRSCSRCGDSVTEAEVRAAHLRDRRDEAVGGARADRRAARVASSGPPTEPLGAEEREEIERKLERLARRREALGPVNPLAEQEYAEALEHVDELEEQRAGPRVGARRAHRA